MFAVEMFSKTGDSVITQPSRLSIEYTDCISAEG